MAGGQQADESEGAGATESRPRQHIECLLSALRLARANLEEIMHGKHDKQAAEVEQGHPVRLGLLGLRDNLNTGLSECRLEAQQICVLVKDLEGLVKTF